jgi:hypothetical protein
MSKVACAACGHQIDAAARLCPYCSADPRSGEKVVDTESVMQEVFRPREVSTSESVIEYARQRQGLVIAVAVMVIFLGLALLHQFVTRRSEAAAAASPAVPLTEISDLSNQPSSDAEVPLPDLDFQYQGQPKRMQTFIVEQGAVAPPQPPAQPPVKAATRRPVQPTVQPPAQPAVPSPVQPAAQPPVQPAAPPPAP